MFTGLVEGMGEVTDVIAEPPGIRIVVDPGELSAGVEVGASIAINGCCLTVVALASSRWEFEAGEETCRRTNLGQLVAGSRVNLERSLSVGDPLGGHFVTGHIDGLGRLRERIDDGQWSTFWFSVPTEMVAQMASKGSIAVDGVSLTLVDVTGDAFSVALIPHTLDVTTLGQLQSGDAVNLETDVLAKYVAAQLNYLRQPQ